ncbi:hypothetical protein LA080_012591 [Diaporthe eres]|nr:hypothetical protein LA080_012591 [Diaporthe eres]
MNSSSAYSVTSPNPVSRALVIVHDLEALVQAILPNMQTGAQTIWLNALWKLVLAANRHSFTDTEAPLLLMGIYFMLSEEMVRLLEAESSDNGVALGNLDGLVAPRTPFACANESMLDLWRSKSFRECLYGNASWFYQFYK